MGANSVCVKIYIIHGLIQNPDASLKNMQYKIMFSLETLKPPFVWLQSIILIDSGLLTNAHISLGLLLENIRLRLRFHFLIYTGS